MVPAVVVGVYLLYPSLASMGCLCVLKTYLIIILIHSFPPWLKMCCAVSVALTCLWIPCTFSSLGCLRYFGTYPLSISSLKVLVIYRFEWVLIYKWIYDTTFFLQQLEIKFIYHTVHPFKVYSLVGFVYSQGCANVTTIQFQNILIFQKKKKTPDP